MMRRFPIRQPAHRAPQRHGRHHSHSACRAALRQAFPHATLGWLIEERWAELLCTLRYPRSGPRSPQRPLVDRVHSVNTAEWRRAIFSFNTWQQMAVGLSDLRGIQYDAVIDFQGAVRSGIAGPLVGRAHRLWERATARKCRQHVLHAKSAFDQRMARMSSNRRWRWREAVIFVTASPFHGGASAGGVSRSTPMRRARSPSLIADAKNDFAILNPGAGWGAKMWPAERYGQVARELAKDGLCSLINYGPGRRRAGRCGGSRQRRGGAKNFLLDL
jgi:heptosyltransferase I